MFGYNDPQAGSKSNIRTIDKYPYMAAAVKC
jgi:hypothetical protein